MTAKNLREKFLEFFRQKKHTVIPSTSLIPENDPSALFISAGMHPLASYLLGEAHPGGPRLANVQKCIRTSDIDAVGDAWHLTFFEMLGNWSLGDYFKREAIEWSWEFLIDTKWLGIEPQKLYITVFEGDQDAPLDKESIKLWQEQFRKVNIEAKVGERIFPLPKEDNWWGPVGEVGPCGPDTEMFYDTGRAKCGPNCRPGCACGKYSEIWNDVFMEYEKKVKSQKEAGGLKVKIKKEYEFVPLKQKNVDTGMGVERVLAVLRGQDNVYETEFFVPIIHKIIHLTGKKAVNKKEILLSDQKPIRIIADHLKAATFILGDDFGVVPSNIDQGYILRRLIRRAIRYGKKIGLQNKFTDKIARVIIEQFQETYPELARNQKRILEELIKEEDKFSRTLERGLKEFNKIKTRTQEFGHQMIQPLEVFHLYDTYGFPLEMTQELAQEAGFSIDEEAFREEFKKHQELSRQGAKKRFKGGLVDASEKTVKLHTATHLLHQALKDVLGDHVAQKGSNITPERLRFDFTHPDKLTPEEIQKVEDIVNQKINANLAVRYKEMTVAEAKKAGAIGLFEHKYAQKVKVYSINEYSREICGGPHIKRTSELGTFKIKKEESSAAGIRRIKAILK